MSWEHDHPTHVTRPPTQDPRGHMTARLTAPVVGESGSPGNPLTASWGGVRSTAPFQPLQAGRGEGVTPASSGSQADTGASEGIRMGTKSGKAS